MINTDLQRFTRLPVEVINKADNMSPTIIVKTPMGEKNIELKNKHYPFLFGSVTQTDKNLADICDELRKLEDDSREYLLQGWLLREKNI